MRFDDLKAAALKLAAEDRAELVHTLILSLEEEQDTTPELKRLWIEEAESRYRELLEGKVEAVPGEEALRLARASLR